MFEIERLSPFSKSPYDPYDQSKFIILIIDRPMASLSITSSMKDNSLGQAKNMRALPDIE